MSTRKLIDGEIAAGAAPAVATGAIVSELLALEDACPICGGDRRCDGTRHERAAEGDEDCRGGAPRP